MSLRRSLLALCLALVLLVMGAAPSAARSPRPPVHGIYENCSPRDIAEDCLQRLAEIRELGISRVLNYWVWQADPAQVLAYAARAQTLGLTIVWPIPANWSETEIRTAVALVRELPATWGYYVGEEVMDFESEEATRVHEVAATVRSADPQHPRLYVGWGGWGPQATRRLIRPFAADAEYLAADYYPVGIRSITVDQTRAVAQAVKRVARSRGRRAAIVLQAFSWASEPTLAPGSELDWRWPTAREMRRMRNHAWRARIRAIFWFDYYFIKPPGTTDDSYAGRLERAIAAPLPRRRPAAR